MTRVLGVDGGQSGIRLRHSSAERVLELPGVGHQEGDAVEGVTDVVARGWQEGGFGPVDRVVLGLTTAPVDPAPANRLCARIAAATGVADVWLTDDAVTGHAGALSLGWGISLIVGTGVACLARPSDDREPRVIGGHGFLLGDEGGGFWIGRAGIRAVLRAADGRGEPTGLASAVERRFGAIDGLHVRIHSDERPVQAIARFAPDVLAAAADGDAVAGGIADEAAAELALVLRAGASWLGRDDSVPVGLGGRLLAPDSGLRDRLEARLAAEPGTWSARSADGSPLDGAILLGLSDDPAEYAGLVHRWTAAGAIA